MSAPIRGQEVGGLFWGSDGEEIFKARRFLIYKCCNCGVNLDNLDWVCKKCWTSNKLSTVGRSYVWHCGKCGINLETGVWKCSRGHLNE